MKVSHARRTAIAILSLLRADTLLAAGNINALRLRRLLWAKTQLRRLEAFAHLSRQRTINEE